jgi:hypothetical protein
LVLRGAIGDLYYNSWRFLGANLAVGGLLVVIALAAVGSAWLLALLPLAAVPAAGTMRMATTLIRDGHADFGDFAEVVRHPRRVLIVGVVQSLVFLVLIADVRLGAFIGSFLGLLLTVGALYGLAIGWAYAAAAWTLMLDPARDDDPLAARLRLAAIVLLAHPIRVGGFLLLTGLLLALTALLIAPFLTFTIALAWLAIARYVLPVADRIEGRATMVVDS